MKILNATQSNPLSKSILSSRDIFEIPSFLLCADSACIFAESVILAPPVMDDCISRLAQLFFCLYTLRNMPSLRGYHSIKLGHSSLPDIDWLPTRFPDLFAIPSSNYTDVEPAQS